MLYDFLNNKLLLLCILTKFTCKLKNTNNFVFLDKQNNEKGIQYKEANCFVSSVSNAANYASDIFIYTLRYH